MTFKLYGKCHENLNQGILQVKLYYLFLSLHYFKYSLNPFYIRIGYISLILEFA
jgi:hypothetical protein